MDALEEVRAECVAARRRREAAEAAAAEAPELPDLQAALEAAKRGEEMAVKAYFAKDRELYQPKLSAAFVAAVKEADRLLESRPDRYYFTEGGRAMLARRDVQDRLAAAEKARNDEEVIARLRDELAAARAVEKALNASRRYTSRR